MNNNISTAIRLIIDKQTINFDVKYIEPLIKKVKTYFKYRTSNDPVYYVIPRALINGTDYSAYLKEMHTYSVKLRALIAAKNTVPFEDWMEKFRR